MAALPKAEADFIREWITDAEANGTVDAAREEVMKQYALTRGQLNAILAWRKIYADRAEMRMSSVEVTDFTEVGVQSESSGSPEVVITTQEAVSILEGGEHFDYDNEIKNRWRETLSGFIDRHTDASKRRYMHVLCLPGKLCLEVPMYTSLGFQPQNILGVEGGDRAARAEFQKNAEKFGIRAFVGDLEECVSSTDEQFNVVSYDFLGPTCAKYERIVAATPVAEDALLLMNVMMKREVKRSQYQVQAFSPGLYGNVRQMVENGELGLDDVRSHVRKEMWDSLTQNAELQELATLRPGSLAVLYSNSLGVHRTDRQLCQDDAWILGHGERAQRAFDEVCRISGDTIDRYKGGIDGQYASFLLRGIISAVWHRLSLLTKLEEYKYTSSANSSPFHSIFMQLHTPLQRYYGMRKTLEFIIQSAKFLLKSSGNISSFSGQVRDKHFAIKPQNAALSPSDVLQLQDESRSTFSSIKLKSFIEDIKSYAQFGEMDLKCKIIAGGYISEIQEISQK